MGTFFGKPWPWSRKEDQPAQYLPPDEPSTPVQHGFKSAFEALQAVAQEVAKRQDEFKTRQEKELRTVADWWEALAAYAIEQGVADKKHGARINVQEGLCPQDLLERLKALGHRVHVCLVKNEGHEHYPGAPAYHSRVDILWAERVNEKDPAELFHLDGPADYLRQTGHSCRVADDGALTILKR